MVVENKKITYWVTKGKRVKLEDLETAHLVRIKQFIQNSPKWKSPMKEAYVARCQELIDYKDKYEEAFDNWFYNILKPFEKKSLTNKTAFLRSYFINRNQRTINNKISK